MRDILTGVFLNWRKGRLYSKAAKKTVNYTSIRFFTKSKSGYGLETNIVSLPGVYG